MSGLMERSLTLRGYQVVSQRCRDTFGSGGVFLPFQSDAEDGADTLKWIIEQSWYRGHVLMFGFSYPAYAEWALAAERLKACCPVWSSRTLLRVFMTYFGRKEPSVWPTY